MSSVTDRPRWEYIDSDDAPSSPTDWPTYGASQAYWIEAIVTEATNDPGVGFDVEGIPRPLVELYAQLASRHATVRQVDPGVWVARVVGLDGAWADGDTPEEALAALPESIIGWVAVKRRLGANDIPPMEGLDLNSV